MVLPLRYDEFRASLRAMAHDDTVAAFARSYEAANGWRSWDSLWGDDCAKFVIDGVDIYDETVTAFGTQMAHYKALQFPAESTFVQWQTRVRLNDSDELVTQDTALFIRVLSSSGAHLKVGFLHAALVHGGDRGLDIPYSADLYGEYVESLLNSDGSDLNDMGLTLKTYVEEMLSFLAIIACKGLARDAVTPNLRQQARRQKKGMPPLPTFVRISTTTPEIEREAAQIGFSRSSPRPHFRRGHIRTLHRDTDGQKIVTVAPSWVNAEPGEVRIRPYTVTK